MFDLLLLIPVKEEENNRPITLTATYYMQLHLCIGFLALYCIELKTFLKNLRMIKEDIKNKILPKSERRKKVHCIVLRP